MAIETIDKLIGLLGKLKSLPAVNPGTSNRLFTGYVTPTYKLMRLIHVDYIGALHLARASLFDQDMTIVDPDERAKRQLQVASETVWKRRKKYENKRDLLRQDSQAYISNLHVVEMRRFFVAVCDYLVLDDDRGFIWVDNERDQFIEGLAERGGLAKYDTPTTKFLREIKDADSIEEGARIVNDVLNHLNTKYFNIVSAYTALEMKRHIF